MPEVSPRLFSFNSPHGACQECSGLGTLMRVDPEKVVVDKDRSIEAGAVGPWRAGSGSYRMKMVEYLADAVGFKLLTPWKKLSKKVRDTSP